MKALVYDGIQKVDYREVTDLKIEKIRNETTNL